MNEITMILINYILDQKQIIRNIIIFRNLDFYAIFPFSGLFLLNDILYICYITKKDFKSTGICFSLL